MIIYLNNHGTAMSLRRLLANDLLVCNSLSICLTCHQVYRSFMRNCVRYLAFFWIYTNS